MMPKTSPPPLSVRVLLRLSQLCGATPIHLHINAPAQQQSPLHGRRLCIRRLTNGVHMLWTAAIYAAIALSMYKQFRTNAAVLNSYTSILSLCDSVTSLLNLTIVMVGSNWQRSQFATFSSALAAMDTQMAVGFHMADREFRSMAVRLSAFVRLMFAGGALLLANTAVVIAVYNMMRFEPMLIATLTYALPNIVLVLTLMQYCSALFVVQQRFDCVAVALGRMRQRRADGDDDVGELGLKRLSVSHDGGDDVKWLLARLTLAQRLYRELGAVERSVHRSFGVLMVSTLVTSILMVTIELYQFYALAVQGVTFTWLLHSIDWLLLHSGKLAVALYMSTMVGEAKSRVATALHEIRVADDFGLNSGVLTTITQFSLQILHEARYLKACGILKLDLTLIGSIVGSLTTYLVILIQFDSSTKSSPVEQSVPEK